jgi:glycosyltransferase involved in cell wall biosynthesis
MSLTGRKLMQRLSRFIPSHIICNSGATADDFQHLNDRVTVIPSGVDSDRFAPNGSPPIGHARVGMIARFAPIKGQHIFVQAVRELNGNHPTAEFVLAGAPLFGEDQYAERVRAAAVADSSHTVRFIGFVDDVPGLLRQLDVVVAPSTQPEGFGQSIVEAMMAGKPVIASASGGPVDVIEDGVTGRLVPPGDVAALTRAISEMLDDPDAASQMGRRGRERALRLYDIRETTRQIERVYERVLASR